MLIPPALIRVATRSWTWWLPVFLLWPLLVVALALLFILAGLAAAASSPSALRQVPASVAATYRVICAVRGTTIDLSQRSRRCVVTIH